MVSSLRTPVGFFLSSLMLFLMGRQVGYYLAPWGIDLALSGLLITLPCLVLPRTQGLTLVILLGFFQDAQNPLVTAFGLTSGLYVIIFLILEKFRHRLSSQDAFIPLLTAICINIAVTISFSLIFMMRWPSLLHGWLRVLVGLMFSEFITILISGWFFALQRKTIHLIGGHPLVSRHHY